MKLSIKFICIILFLSNGPCKGQEKIQVENEIIVSFINDIIKSDALDFPQFYEYTNVHKSSKGNPKFETLIKFVVDQLRTISSTKEMTKSQVVSYKEALILFKGTSSEERLNNIHYSNTDFIYFWIFPDDIQKGEFLMFIIKNDKITSFFPYAHITDRQKIVPFLLNKKHKEEDFILMKA
ncbi:hypothetical protein ACIGCP_08380 [Cellulophaga baltica]|uniref:hypothetical protein n=1 Tax=Cellulophaga baltica TaxID=76594 RepID=UPI0037CB502A